MSNKFKTIFLSVALTGFVFSSSAALADKGHIFPGITDPCEQLWVVNDPMNADADADFGGGECIDVPVNLDEVKVVFNLDNAVTSTTPIAVKDDAGNVVGKTFEINPVGIRHMALLGKVMQHRIAIGEMDFDDVAIVGIFHGPAMKTEKWPFKNGMPAHVKKWVDKIFALQNAGINIQLEVCGVTLKGMQKKAREFNKSGWFMMDERAIYSNTDDDGIGPNTTGRIYVNQGAVGRIIELQQHGFAYLQEE